jgi:Putative capsular polysaccharide synthesis protein
MSDFSNRLLRTLRGLKQKVRPTDISRRYQRRLDREISRVRQTFEGTDNIVLTHTYGKVGSTAIHKAVSKLPGYASFQTHFISEQGIADALQLHQEEHDPIHMLQGEALRLEMEAQPDRLIRVVTLVRDPVARAISDLFENPATPGSNGDLRELPLDSLVTQAAEKVVVSLAYTEQWFDRELSGVLGFDFFTRGFDKHSGFEIHREGRFELLAGKLEQLSDHGAGYLGRFLGLGRDFPIPRSRARSATGEADLYAQVRRSLKLPASLLDEVYSSRVCRHFYTPEELDGFRNLWIQSR